MSESRQAPSAVVRGHTFRDLVFVGVSGASGEIVSYGAQSQSDKAKTNLVSLDVQTGDVTCTCIHCETHPNEPCSCWLARLIDEAWERHPAHADVRWLTDSQLLAYGKKLASFARQYRERTGRALQADEVNLLAARSEWKRRETRRQAQSEVAA